jgi:class 3 adenylate cyclase
VTRRAENPILSERTARYVADHIPDAQFKAVPGRDALPYIGESAPVLDAIQEFLTGARPAPLDDRVLATVLFTDIVASTARATELGDQRWRALLDRHDALVAENVDRFRGRFIKQTGDGALATFDGPARAVHCARSLRDQLGGIDLAVRAGLHAGEVELRSGDVGGIAVHIGARVGGLAQPGEVLVSRTVRDLVAGSGLMFESRGEHALKGISEPWEVFALV